MKRIFHRILTCLTLCTILSSSLALTASAAQFEDVPDSHWAAASIRECVELGFFNGESAARFGVGHQMTRSAFAVVLCRFFGWETTAPTQAIFSDVPTDAWYSGAVESAFRHGAFTDQRAEFRPADPITREELAVALVRALGYGTIAGLGQDLTNPFQDVTTNTGYITMAYHLGLVSGTSADTFSPARHASREQVAVILMRLYHKLHSTTPERISIITAPEMVEEADIAAIPAARIISSKLTTAMPEEEASAALDAARQAGLPTLLYVTGSGHALNSYEATADALLSAVNDGGYDGLFLDLAKLSSSHRKPLDNLVKKLNSTLGDKLLYLAAEAPTRNGKIYQGYNYAALADQVDHLVLRVASYADTSGDLPIAPAAPPEELYYAYTSLPEVAATGKLSLMFSAERSSWSEKKEASLTEEEFQALLAKEDTLRYSSERYASSYLTGSNDQGKSYTVWYLEPQDLEVRFQLAALLGAHAVCIVEA